MRTWFRKHPNVAVVLLGLWILWIGFDLVRNVYTHRWVWVAIGVGALYALAEWFTTWWRRT